MTAPIAFRRDGTILRGKDMAGTVRRCGHACWSLRLTANPAAAVYPSARDARNAAVAALVASDGGREVVR